MKRYRHECLTVTLAAGALGALLLTSCERRTSQNGPAGVAEHQQHPAANEASASKVSAKSPAQDLAALDTRRPVPLLPIMAWHQKQSMMQHLVVIQQIVSAAADEKWSDISEAAKGIEASERERQSCEHMGAGAEGFTELALEFHDRATAIREAAESHDGPAVLRATAHALEACTSCHATYRQEVLDESGWKARTMSDSVHADPRR